MAVVMAFGNNILERNEVIIYKTIKMIITNVIIITNSEYNALEINSFVVFVQQLK